ncbi:hypothetical protein BJX68DRAFT_99905 [Aspergillus pseudodeflectus]|uniref:Secreted protein n=1 Tax=Aspergillus pseudodeflectus TaxID=176178 RepID=A0ABR4K8K9_9EURO
MGNACLLVASVDMFPFVYLSRYFDGLKRLPIQGLHLELPSSAHCPRTITYHFRYLRIHDSVPFQDARCPMR